MLGALLMLAAVALALSALDARGTLDGTKDPLALGPGDCIELSAGGVLPSDVPIVACSDDHDAEVVGLLDADEASADRSPTSLCLDALTAYTDPEQLALTRLDPVTTVRAVPVRLPQSTDEVWRCILDVRESSVAPHSVRR